MALVSSCMCCSLLTAAIMSGIICTFLYTVAFALEIWWILEARVALSVPGYILAAAYLLMVFISLLLLLGLRTKRTRLLLSWILLNIIYIFPEAGLVLFMSIYHWNGQTYGIIELTLWALRVAFNVFGIVSVQSLWSFWKDEKSIFRSLQELGNTNGGVVSTGVGDNLGIPGQLKLRGSLRYSSAYQSAPLVYNNNHPLGYSNPAFSSSAAHINGSLAVTKYMQEGNTNLKRTSSSASGFVSASRISPTKPNYSQSFSRNEFSPGTFSRSQSHFDLPSFGLDPDSPVFLQDSYGPGGLPVNIYRGNTRRDKLLSERMEWYRPRSLGNLEVDLDSISLWSGQYESRSYNGHYLGLDDKYRAASLGNINLGYSRDWRDSRGSKQSLGQVSGVSDNPERYRDIAL